MSMTFEQLTSQYESQTDEQFVEVTDKQAALSDLRSKTSCCWGAGFKFGGKDAEWIQLATPSKRAGQIRSIFVCRKSLVADQIDHETDSCVYVKPEAQTV